MTRLQANRSYLRDLYTASGPQLAILIHTPLEHDHIDPWDYTLSDRPVTDWVGPLLSKYEAELKRLDELPDDKAPYIDLCRNTGIFPAAFGCELHTYDGGGAAAARPCVFSSEDLKLLPKPSLDAPTLRRTLELAEALVERAGPDIAISVPDIQSSFGIAAIIWEKSSMMISMMTEPEAIKDLVAQTHELLKLFLLEFKRIVPNCSMCHCPSMWVPAELGCHLSEDEIGIISLDMFEEFCLPHLIDLSETFGGLWMHCCADADHQYVGIAKIPNLRGLNRKFHQGARPCIDMFSDSALFSMGCTPEEELMEMLDMALPQSRFLFEFYCRTMDEGKGLVERFHARIPRD